MEILRLISRLMDYPEADLTEDLDWIKAIINNDQLLTVEDKGQLLTFVQQQCDMELLDLQADYDALFERGRSVSLLLFEHVHGESRDRGQAMIDLIEQYKQAGLDIGVRELPDYIPLFLEFLSTQGQENAVSWLQDVAHILALLKVRLEKRDSGYATLFAALVSMSGMEIDYAHLTDQVKSEKADHTKEAMDKVWEEEVVKFTEGAEPGCPTNQHRPSESQRKDTQVPITFMDAAINAEAKPHPVSQQTAGGI